MLWSGSSPIPVSQRVLWGGDFLTTFPALPRETVPAAAAPHSPKPQSATPVTTAAAPVLTSLSRRPRTGSSDQHIATPA